MAEGEKCVLCKGPMEHKYAPMTDWDVKGPLCGKCYSKKIFEHYPGQHVRVNLDKE
ncbi:MAG: hypothetical protein HZC29_00110 [Thaumarchaeota archaeon]|nr:hypothetical protein [Nitrososphaerota archaeon]